MSDTYGRIVAFIVAILFIVLTPSMIMLQFADKLVTGYAETKVEKFVDTCREVGYVSEEAYQNLIQDLGNTGYGFKTELTCETKTSYPTEKDSKFITDFITERNQEIMENCMKIINENNLSGGKYYMRNGDYLHLTVTSVEDTTASVMAKFLTLGAMHGKQITVNYGGFVGTDGFSTKK